MSRRFAQSVKLIVLIIGAFVMMFPFVWMLATSLKTLPESVAIPPILLPDTPQWSNYAEALGQRPSACTSATRSWWPDWGRC